jgi:trimethylamine--corrinoid protein Co-methyltransferase
MPNAGATAPIHPAGALAVGLAETLGGMVLAYAVDENACVTLDVTPGFGDVSTGVFRYAGPERASLIGARIQMISEYYGCPSGVHGGKTDACAMGERVGVEKSLSILFPVLCGAIGLGTVGTVDANTFSPAQLVIDNEIARYIRRSVRGFAVDDETVNVELIRRVGPGGNYLAEDDTAARFRDVLELSPFFTAHTWRSDRTDEAVRWEAMARDRVRELLSREIERPLTREQEREIDRIVGAARREADRAGLS